jgi:hypothetical protein
MLRNGLNKEQILYLMQMLKDAGKGTFKKFIKKETTKEQAIRGFEFKLNIIKNGLKNI